MNRHRPDHHAAEHSRTGFGATSRRLLGTVVLGALLPHVSAETVSDPTPRPRTDAIAFLERIDQLRREHSIPGLSVAVVRDREILLATGLGFADVERGIPATAETAYDIASVAKPLSGVVALRLVEVDVLDLDRPIAEYSDWQDFCRSFSARPSIFARELQCEPAVHTLRHLLSHTATGKPGTRFS